MTRAADTTYRPFPVAVQRQIVERATDDTGQVRCEGCSLALKKWEIDHTIPESTVPEFKKYDDARKQIPLTADDGTLLGACCHRGKNGKTNKDVKAAAKIKRQSNKAKGIKTRRKKAIAAPPSEKTLNPKRNKKDMFPGLPRGGIARQYMER